MSLLTKRFYVMSIRILLLRVLIASWAIPTSWVFIFPLFYLMSGLENAVNDMIKFNRALWNGM